MPDQPLSHVPATMTAALRPHHFGISVPDLDAAIAWYGRVLGFVPERHQHIPHIPADIAFLRHASGFRVEIFQLPGALPLPPERRQPNLDLRTHGHKHICFEVEDVPATIAALRAAGADVALELLMDGKPVAFIRDCAGNLIEFLQPFEADRLRA